MTYLTFKNDLRWNHQPGQDLDFDNLSRERTD